MIFTETDHPYYPDPVGVEYFQATYNEALTAFTQPY
jgi:hypothetical protein